MISDEILINRNRLAVHKKKKKKKQGKKNTYGNTLLDVIYRSVVMV